VNAELHDAGLGDTLVVCRPEQLREAALALSCAPAGTLWPLVALPSPPITEAEYRVRYDAYRAAREKREMLGFGISPASREESLAQMAEVDARAEALTGYRVWAKRSRTTAEVLSRATFRRLVLLFDLPEDELNVIDAVPVSRISERRRRILPEVSETVRLIHAEAEPLAVFSDRCWTTLRTEALPNTAVAVPESDVASYITGLARAARDGLRLRVDPAAAPGPSFVDPAGGERCSEAVLIEAGADAAKLLGVLYARRRGARLIVCPEPDVAPVETARRAMQSQRARSARGSGKGRWKIVTFFMAPEAVRLDELRDAVSATLANDVIDLVGARDLTVFTAGIPYNAVRRGGTDWSRKPIGHIAGDASLLMLHELVAPKQAEASFGLLFDPGFFPGTTETQDVLAQLRSATFYPTVLRDGAASSLALTSLGAALPLEFVFLNTHGSDQSVKFVDGYLPAFKLAQRTTLTARPIVFNSSCESWVGAGRAFISAGARGYIGTLWSVKADEAAVYARTVVGRLVNEHASVAAALRGTSNRDELAYVCIGPVALRLAPTQVTSDGEGVGRIRVAMRTLLRSLRTWLAECPPHPGAMLLVAPLAKTLWERASLLSDELERRPELSSAEEIVDDLLERFATIVDLLRIDPELGPAIAAMQPRIAAALKTLPQSPQTEDRLSRTFELMARFGVRAGNHVAAAGFLEAAIDAARKGTGSPANLYLQLGAAYMAQGESRYEDAIAAAREAQSLATSTTDPAELRTCMNAYGLLARLGYRKGEADAATAYAEAGRTIAEALDDPAEGAAFTRDLARARMVAQDTPAALALAEESLRLAASSNDASSVAASYGFVAEALTGLRRLDDARRAAQSGLELAAGVDDAIAVGDFLCDFARISEREGDPNAAMAAYGDAMRVFARGTSRQKLLSTLARARALAAAAPGWDARRAFIELTVVACAAAPDGASRSSAVDAFVSALYATIAETGAASSAKAVDSLLRSVEAARRPPGGEMEFMRDMLHAFQFWYAGRREEALALATVLDASLPPLRLAEFLTQRPS
jgi:tetratricopeptide (TPR) repeat protein